MTLPAQELNTVHCLGLKYSAWLWNPDSAYFSSNPVPAQDKRSAPVTKVFSHCHSPWHYSQRTTFRVHAVSHPRKVSIYCLIYPNSPHLYSPVSHIDCNMPSLKIPQHTYLKPLSNDFDKHCFRFILATYLNMFLSPNFVLFLQCQFCFLIIMDSCAAGNIQNSKFYSN